MFEFLSQAFADSTQIDPHLTGPNPRVGCVIVDENQIVVATGIHIRHGADHAEAAAVRQLARKLNPTWADTSSQSLLSLEPLLRGLTVYVTLEPCRCFTGKQTPSCTELLIHHQPKKIVIGSIDPIFGGTNIIQLRSAGIEVVYADSFESEQQRLNPFFGHSKERPYVGLKLASTLDGKINLDASTYANGKSYLSSRASRQKVQNLRAEYSAVVTTTKTVIQDDPRLTCRLLDSERNFSDPDIVIIGDSMVDRTAKVFSASATRKVYELPAQPLLDILKRCRQDFLLDSVLLEVGAEMATEFLKKNLVDELQLFICPRVAGKGLAAFSEELDLGGFERKSIEIFENDICIRFVKKNT